MRLFDRVTAVIAQEEPERPFECLRCGIYLDLAYHTCPECGSFSIDRRFIGT